MRWNIDDNCTLSSKKRNDSLIVLATVAETFQVIQNETLSRSDVEAVIKKAAINRGANGDLLAAIISYLPQLWLPGPLILTPRRASYCRP